MQYLAWQCRYLKFLKNFQLRKSILTDQVRRSSRSVCICLLEAYRKKRYVAHFISKVTDSGMENSETSGW